MYSEAKQQKDGYNLTSTFRGGGLLLLQLQRSRTNQTIIKDTGWRLFFFLLNFLTIILSRYK